MRLTRRHAALAASLALLSWSVMGSGVAFAQGRPGKGPDPIDQSKDLSTKPMPSLPAPDQPIERVVPESRQRDPATGREFVTPPRYERSTPGLPSSSPPPGAFPPPGDPLPRVRGR